MRNILAILLTILLVSCGASWRETAQQALDLQYRINKQVHAEGMKGFEAVCIHEARLCVKSFDKECKKARDCVKAARIFTGISTGIDALTLEGQVAISVSDEDKWQRILLHILAEASRMAGIVQKLRKGLF